ncbi:MAG: hypothetical protein QM682_01585 [Paracoccus sp. (in: a-proteobacteria)]|uniref:hypothetical protein n=1 Tax=Paracoccus sp. TaxID=267 RepID=UPI0039E29858
MFPTQLLADVLSVFFIGHSLVSPDLPQMLKGTIDQPVEYQIINGAPLEVQWKDPAGIEGQVAREWLPSHKVDVLVLTERVPLAITMEYHASADYAYRFVESALQGNPQVQSYLYETWDDIDDKATGSTNAWRDRIVSDLPLWQQIADDVNARLPRGAKPMQVIPGGLGMVRLHDAIAAGKVPGASSIRDFFRDDIHPTDAGFYYVAMIHHAVLTGKSPVGLPNQLMGRWAPYATVPPEQARVLQELAQETVTEFDAR